MSIEYSKQMQCAFVIGVCQLKTLTKLLQDSVGDIVLSTSYEDGITREFKTIDDLIAIQNPKSRKIHRIELNAKSDKFLKSARINFESKNILTISVKIDVDEDALPKVRNDLQDIIEGMRPWYDVLSRYPVPYSLGVSAFIAFLIPLIFKEHVLSIGNKLNVESAGEAVSLILYLSVMVFMYPLYKLFSNCFPHGVFAIGQGISRYNRLKWFHGIIAAFIMGLIFFAMRFVIN